MNSGICHLPVIPLRAEPSDKSEMVSQLLYGESFEILQKEKQWRRIRSYFDDYEGWMDEKQMQLLDAEQLKKIQSAPQVCLTDQTATAHSPSRSLLLLIGSSLPLYHEGQFMMGDEIFSTEGDTTLTDRNDLAPRIPFNALKFAGMPYLWGGRSLFGLDCSGFTQLVFKMAGIRLRRDAWQQSEQGILVPFITSARPGDLAFFQNEEGKITHTGVLLGNNKIIHASGEVRVDAIDHYGIFNAGQQRYTHLLRLIKRYIE